MNSQSRNFARQVQTDLLALCDADLVSIIHQWVDRGNSSGIFRDIPDDTLLALGYTHAVPEIEMPQSLHDDEPDTEITPPVLWQAPSSHHLRTLLTAMDVDLFNQRVITLAFRSFHATYPEWYEGAIFNAHLANYLRQINVKRKITR